MVSSHEATKADISRIGNVTQSWDVMQETIQNVDKLRKRISKALWDLLGNDLPSSVYLSDQTEHFILVFIPSLI